MSTLRVGRRASTSTVGIHSKTWLAFLVFATLFALLFQYRILSLMKKLGANVTPIGTKFSLVLDFQHAPQWLLPFYHTLDYLNTIWFTTVLGLLIAGAVVAFLPHFVGSNLKGNGFRHHLAGVLLGLPNMLCTCCAATTVPGLRRAGAGLGPLLAFFITAPALNIIVILLAFQFLPLTLAVTRTLLGVVAAVGVTYAISRLSPAKFYDLDPTASGFNDESIADAFKSWLTYTWDVARTVIPMLLIGFLLIGLFKTFVPLEVVATQLGNGPLPTLLASAVGTVLMVPTFTEVVWVGEFTKHGMGLGPAVALLITLPTVSFPSLWVLGKVIKSYRLAAILGVSILTLGFVSGSIFTLI